MFWLLIQPLLLLSAATAIASRFQHGMVQTSRKSVCPQSSPMLFSIKWRPSSDSISHSPTHALTHSHTLLHTTPQKATITMPCTMIQLTQRESNLSQLARTANQNLERDCNPAERIRTGGLKPLRLSTSVATTSSADGSSGPDDVESLSESSDALSMISYTSFAASLVANGDGACVYTNSLATQTMTSVDSREDPISDEEFERALDALCDYDWTAVTIDEDEESEDDEDRSAYDDSDSSSSFLPTIMPNSLPCSYWRSLIEDSEVETEIDDDEGEEEEQQEEEDESAADTSGASNILLGTILRTFVACKRWRSLIEDSEVETEIDDNDDDDDNIPLIYFVPSKVMMKTTAVAATNFTTSTPEPAMHNLELEKWYLKPLSHAGLQVPSLENLSSQDAGLLLRETILEMVVKYEEEEEYQRRWGMKAGWKGVKKWVGRKFGKLHDGDRMQ
jgi:hypothetical protein